MQSHVNKEATTVSGLLRVPNMIWPFTRAAPRWPTLWHHRGRIGHVAEEKKISTVAKIRMRHQEHQPEPRPYRA